MSYECMEELPLGWCEMHLGHPCAGVRPRFELGIAGADIDREGLVDHVVAEVDRPPSELDGFHRFWLCGAPCYSPNSCQELLDTERLGDVVIGTRVKCVHLGRT